MTQTNRLPVRMQFAGLLTAVRTSHTLDRALNRHGQIAAIKTGVKHADVRQIQWDFNYNGTTFVASGTTGASATEAPAE